MQTKNLNSLFEEANRLENVTTFELNTMNPQDKLVHLTDVFNVHVRIGQVTVYKQGEILTKIKKVCKEAHVSFETYVKENLKISQKTATNYMNVFYYCCGHPEIAEKIQPSILYQVCTDNFEKEIREYLFSTGILEDIHYEKCKTLLQKAKNEGITVIEKEVEEIDRSKLVHNQLSHTLSMAGDAVKSLTEIKRKIEHRGNPANNGIVEFEIQINTDQPEAAEINLKLYEAIKTAIFTLETAISESKDLFQEFDSE